MTTEEIIEELKKIIKVPALTDREQRETEVIKKVIKILEEAKP